MAKKKSKLSSKQIIKIILTLLVIAAFIYLIRLIINEYERQVQATGIVVCAEEGCIKTMHIHSDIRFNLCGETVVLPRETGPLSGLHTHKEKNYLHFHDQVEIQSETKAQLFDQRLSLQEVIDIFDLDPEKFCGTSDVLIKVLVNGQAPEEELEYNWIDGDDIELIYEAK